MADPTKKPPSPLQKKEQPAPEAAPAKPIVPGNPEAEANQRIALLKAQVVELEKEVRTLQGKVANRDPKAAKALQHENGQHRARLAALEKALNAIIAESFLSRDPKDEQLKYEALQKAAIEYLKTNNVDPELWKSIVS